MRKGESTALDSSSLTVVSVGHDDAVTVRWFKRVTAVVVLGYLLLDRAFAWVHIPGIPVFAGEVVFLLAIVVLIVHQRAAAAVIRRSPLLKTAGFLFIWGLLRLSFDLPIWGMSALRDGAQTNYILVGFAAAVVAVRDPGVIEGLSRLRRWIPAVVVIWAPIAIVLNRLYGGVVPLVPDSATSIFSFKPGDYALFTAASVAYVWVIGEHYSSSYRSIVTLLGAIGLLVAASQNRGGVLGALVVLGLASLFMDPARRRRFVSGLGLATGALIFVLAVTNVVIPLGSRAFSVGQLADNTVSVVASSDDSGLQGTVTWRLGYWESVISDVVTGEDWLAGIGYGVNLADVYGYQTGSRGSLQPLRNAHNSHVTLIARLGLVGLFIWAAFWLRLGLLLTRSRRRSIGPIAGWLIAVMAGVGVAAIFDPILEGPQIAIPFWLATGLLAGTLLNTRLNMVSRSRVPGSLAGSSQA